MLRPAPSLMAFASPIGTSLNAATRIHCDVCLDITISLLLMRSHLRASARQAHRGACDSTCSPHRAQGNGAGDIALYYARVDDQGNRVSRDTSVSRERVVACDHQ